MAASASRARENCPICLEPVSGEAFLDHCFHRFCYHCILQWSEMVLAAKKSSPPTLECPLCKSHYTSIIHDLVSATKFHREFLLAPNGGQFRLSEAHRRRLSVYQTGGASPEARTIGVVKVNKWLSCFVRRELQALMQDEDVNMVVHHVVGVVESLQKRARGAKEASFEAWCGAVAAAVRPFVFEDAEVFAVEVWKFLEAGIDIAFYDQWLVDQGVAHAAADADSGTARPALGLFDEFDVEDG